MAETRSNSYQKSPSLFGLVKPYKWLISALVFCAVVSNAFNLFIPKIISNGIDSFTKMHVLAHRISVEFVIATLGIFLFAALQSIVQTYASERVARDMRKDIAAKISRQSYAYVESVSSSKLLTILTSDVDSIKNFVAQAISSLISSVFIIIGVSILMLTINWRLGLAVILIIPIIGGTFFFVLRKVRVLFTKSREVLDWLNRVINESILGAAIIRVLNAQQPEYEKFIAANTDARNIGISILKLFSAMIPIITFVANLAVVTILMLGGHYVIGGTMTLGNFAAFNTYVSILIFPILVIGFMSNVIALATASYTRILEVLDSSEEKVTGTVSKKLTGEITVSHLTLLSGEKYILKDVSFIIKPGTKTAIIGPTAAGKTQLLYALVGLITPTSGEVKYDDTLLKDFDPENLHEQIGFVFQDSIMFNMSVRENIAFNESVTKESLQKAIATSELDDFITTLPQGLQTVVSERGTSLSGGQKQRVMLARALALDPRIIFLDDFTARVDTATERKILNNVDANYTDTTLISVTQKIGAIEAYDQIILLMEGELLAIGTHDKLLKTSPEYVQIYQSQESTTQYELQK